MGMTLTQHELLCQIYHTNKVGVKALAKMAHKSTLAACIRKGWVIQNGDHVELTELAFKDAKRDLCDISGW
jgi:predicted transposase YbfD/YdcC